MSRVRTYFALGLTALVGLPACLSSAAAQSDYPVKPVTIVVDRAAGGGTDIAARQMAERLTKELGQQFIVDNQPGAAGRIAQQGVLATDPDGYTLLVVGSSYTVNPALYSLDFDPVEDFKPIVCFSQGGLLLVANPKLGVKTLKELLELAKQKPGEVASATVGSGSISDLSTGMMGKMAGAEFTSVQYKGAGPAMIDTIAGVTDILFSSPANAIPQVKGDALVALATTSEFPMPGMEDVPTFEKAGLPGYSVLEWYGVLAPKGIPEEAVEAINKVVNDMLKDPAVVERLNADGLVPAGGSAEEFKERIKDGIARWKQVAADMNITPH